MIGKLIVHADTASSASNRMAGPCASSRSARSRPPSRCTMRLMENADFRKGGVDIHYLERMLKA
jgi:biotin carboxylase